MEPNPEHPTQFFFLVVSLQEEREYQWQKCVVQTKQCSYEVGLICSTALVEKLLWTHFKRVLY